MNRRSLLIGAGGAALAACATAAPQTEAATLPLADELDDLIARGMGRVGVVPGLSVAVYSPDGVYTRGFGVTDVTTGERADADTCFYIASSTKPLTALALASRAARGEIDLDTTLASFAPDAPFPAVARANQATFRDLLSHTSGIANDPISFRLAYSGDHDAEMLWRLLGVSSANAEAPLGTFNYTNTGYNIATILTDRRFGAPWQDMLEREVFGPAGMARASARMSRAVAQGWKIAKPHMALPEGMRKLYLEKVDRTMHSAGGVIMSANDAVRWLELMIEDGKVGARQVIPAAAVQSTRARLATVDAEFAGYRREAYGLGWYHGPYRDEAMLHHFGGFAGARAHVSYIPARRIGIAAFVTDNATAAIFADAVANYVYDRTANRGDAVAVFDAKLEAILARRDQVFARIAADRATRAGRAWTLGRPRAAYAGGYENANFGRIEVTAVGEELRAAFGVMHSASEPYGEPESIRVEFLPYSGEGVVFQGESARPRALVYDGQTYIRA